MQLAVAIKETLRNDTKLCFHNDIHNETERE